MLNHCRKCGREFEGRDNYDRFCSDKCEFVYDDIKYEAEEMRRELSDSRRGDDDDPQIEGLDL